MVDAFEELACHTTTQIVESTNANDSERMADINTGTDKTAPENATNTRDNDPDDKKKTLAVNDITNLDELEYKLFKVHPAHWSDFTF